jgi:hypothetical protein
MISRDAGSAMNRQRRSYESTAYHEAGHAVAAFVLRLKIGRRGVNHRARLEIGRMLMANRCTLRFMG